jgi:hypothetical protein
LDEKDDYIMEALELIRRTRNYLDYLEEHILNVRKAWSELQEKCKDMRFIYDDYVYHWIGGEVEEHDLSKLSEHEFVQYRKVFYPASFEPKSELLLAWEHHKLNNKHHWENWTNISRCNPYEWEVHCVHMVIDWMAMSYKLGGTAKKYYENNKEKIKIPDFAVDFIYEIFKRIEV